MFKKLGKKKKIFIEVMTTNVAKNHKKSSNKLMSIKKKNSTFFVLIISFLNESTKNKMYQKQKLLPYCEPEKT